MANSALSTDVPAASTSAGSIVQQDSNATIAKESTGNLELTRRTQELELLAQQYAQLSLAADAESASAGNYGFEIR